MHVAKFPTKHLVIKRLGLDREDELTMLDAELRRIDAALTALKARKKAVLKRYRQLGPD